jgi:hypothetical protein
LPFKGKTPFSVKFVFTTKLLKRLTVLNIANENGKDITEKIINYNRAIGMINQLLKSNLAQKHKN